MALDEAIKRLRIRIVGAGMGGLACALACAKEGFEDIEVFETTSSLGFVGAGIQLAPNMARILDELGVWRDIEKEAVPLRDTSIRQGSTDTELGNVKLDYVKKTYGYAHMVGHRASLASSMYEGCKRSPYVKFHFSTAATGIESFGPSAIFTATPRDGTPYRVEADVLLAADGIKSNVRVEMLKALGVTAEITETNTSAYRIMLTRAEMEHDAELLALLDQERATRWIGEKRHIIAYPVSNNQIYNLSTTQPDIHFAAAPSESYTTKASKKLMLEVFGDFCPMILRMLNLVPEGEVCEWKLRIHERLPTWIHGSVGLLGDACHPTLPHLAQGAAQAIEDAAVIGIALSKLPDTSPQSINKALRVYEKIRMERAYTLVDLASANARGLHLGDGEAQKERDRQFAALKEGKGPVPDKWADADLQKMIYGFDCIKVTQDSFEELFKSFD